MQQNNQQENTEAPMPKCIGMIMDGNRRWAKSEGLTSLEGHTHGYEKVKEVADWMKEAGVPNLILYAFSTENWNRSEKEVSYLMDLFRKMLTKEVDEFYKKGVKLLCAGERERLPKDLKQMIRDAEEKTKNNTQHTLVLCISYGGRAEILNATNQFLKEGKESVTEDEFSNALWTNSVPDPDIIIRTSGEQRLSGFLAWQSVYSELFFIDTHWPAFSKEEFFQILDEFAERERRHGK